MSVFAKGSHGGHGIEAELLIVYVDIGVDESPEDQRSLAQNLRFAEDLGAKIIRAKGKNVAEEYKKLQADYARLNKEIETWKQLIAKTPSGPAREEALDQIREREKAFTATRRNEAAQTERTGSRQSWPSSASRLS